MMLVRSEKAIDSFRVNSPRKTRSKCWHESEIIRCCDQIKFAPTRCFYLVFFILRSYNAGPVGGQKYEREESSH